MVYEWIDGTVLLIDLFWNIFSYRKRSLSDCQPDDLDNTRDSVLSDQSQFSITEPNNDPELMIIDFEYCAYNYRGFDLANHFNEWMFDYTNKEYPFYFFKKDQYPNKEQQVNYLEFCPFYSQIMKIVILINFFNFRSASSSPIWSK